MGRLINPTEIQHLLNLKLHECEVLRNADPNFPRPAPHASTPRNRKYDYDEVIAWARNNDIKTCLREGYRLRRYGASHGPPQEKLSPLQQQRKRFLRGDFAPVGYTPKRTY